MGRRMPAGRGKRTREEEGGKELTAAAVRRTDVDRALSVWLADAEASPGESAGFAARTVYSGIVSVRAGRTEHKEDTEGGRRWARASLTRRIRN